MFKNATLFCVMTSMIIGCGLPNEVKINYAPLSAFIGKTKRVPDTLGSKPNFILRDKNKIEELLNTIYHEKTEASFSSDQIFLVIDVDNKIIYIDRSGIVSSPLGNFKVNPVGVEKFLKDSGIHDPLKGEPIPDSWDK